MGKEDSKEKKGKKTSSGHLSEEVEEGIERLPNMEVSRLVYLLKCGQAENASATQQELMALIKKDSKSMFVETLIMVGKKLINE